MNCTTIKTLVKGYFTPTMPLEVRDEIVSHLVVCEDCLKAYTEYAKSIGLKFDLNKEIMKIYNMYAFQKPEAKLSDIQLTDVVSDGILEQVCEARDTFYTRKARQKDVSAVMNVRAVRELALELKQLGADNEKFSDFAWYLVEDRCKKVDMLNSLYELSGGKKER